MSENNTRVCITYDDLTAQTTNNTIRFMKSYSTLAKTVESGIKIFRKFYDEENYPILGVVISNTEGTFTDNKFSICN